MHGLAALAANTSGHGRRIVIVGWILEAKLRKGNSPNLHSLMIFFRSELFIKMFG
jgi:hypothetical protein